MVRIAITGPECCGKSTLAKWLGENLFDSKVVTEYARQYLCDKGDAYEYNKEDILTIARKTAAYLTKAFKSNIDALIVDTDFYVLDVWWNEKYGDHHPEIVEMKHSYDFDLYLLCLPDLPWEEDPLRENPDDRERLYQIYQQELIKDGRTVEIVRGTGEERMSNILAKILRRFPKLMTEED